MTFEALAAELEAAREQRERIGTRAAARREHAAAPRLAAAVLERLGELAMADARFEVALQRARGWLWLARP